MAAELQGVELLYDAPGLQLQGLELLYDMPALQLIGIQIDTDPTPFLETGPMYPLTCD